MDCCLCSEIRSDPHGQHAEYGHVVTSGRHILCTTDQLVCLPSLGPLNANHLLIVPKVHYKSSAAIADTSTVRDLELVKSAIVAYNRSMFECETAFFEHGTGTIAEIACACIEHAHIHAIGTNLDIIAFLREHYAFEPISAIELIGNATLASTGYYFYEHTKSQGVACTQMLEPQFFRIMFWRILRQWTPWNWRLYYNVSRVEEVITNYKNLKVM